MNYLQIVLAGVQSYFAVMDGRFTVNSIGLQRVIRDSKARRWKMTASVVDVPPLRRGQPIDVGHPFW